jgi:hypothetical protein
VGIKVNKNGEVELRGDLGMISPQDKLKLEAELTKMYTSTAVAKVLQRMGYSVQAQKTQEKVIINARN